MVSHRTLSEMDAPSYLAVGQASGQQSQHLGLALGQNLRETGLGSARTRTDCSEQLAGDGARELILVAQDTTSYGLDADGRPRLADLLARLVEVDSVEWLRLMYLYPMHVTDELIELVASSPKVLSYLDLPLQHASDSVLRRMGRRVGRQETDELIDRLRQRIEHLVLRTTMLVGFPGESEDELAGVCG